MAISINWVDVVLVLLLIGGFALGFMRGILWEFIGLASFYIGTVISSQYYFYLSDFFSHLLGQSLSSRTSYSFAFILILFAVSLILNWVIIDAIHSTKLQIPASLDYLGGTMLGFISTLIILIILVPVFTFAISDTWSQGWPESIREFLATQSQKSFFIPLLDELKPLFVETLRLWLPQRLPEFFNL